MANLQSRIERLERLSFEQALAELEKMSDEELDEFIGPDCCGVPWDAFTEADLESLIAGNYKIIEQVRARAQIGR